MAKISELPGITNATGSVLPVVLGGVTSQISMADFFGQGGKDFQSATVHRSGATIGGTGSPSNAGSVSSYTATIAVDAQYTHPLTTQGVVMLYDASSGYSALVVWNSSVGTGRVELLHNWNNIYTLTDPGPGGGQWFIDDASGQLRLTNRTTVSRFMRYIFLAASGIAA